ncbi:hypothetical protein OB955_18350 [Halobacteria archaeon AArc-m2/3/4]|uniref:Uncharacterized protein n=1 Tax=Natronoglomus mannanivorans TaxID=2979990 RepID=A0ABT2QIC9_9EURY|nr:hypothetical protein [Halobacteria archaeon AArc-m2/3/4]
MTISDVVTKEGEPNDPIGLTWSSNVEVEYVTYKAGNLPIKEVSGGSAGSFEVTDGSDRDDLSPPNPCDTEHSVKFEWSGGGFNPE